MTTLSDFKKFTTNLKKQDHLMPVLFIGHGSPMNGIEHNQFSENWANLAKEIPLPTAILVVSAHWLSRGTKITAMDFPQTIHDFGGFPQELFDVQYPAPGNPQLAQETASIIKSTNVELNHDWGLDHGAWTVIRNMYPDAKVPVLQLSIDYTKGPQFHYELAKELSLLRNKGVLIMGSGNMVHNLRMVSFDKIDTEFGFDWAIEMNEVFKKNIISRNHQALINYENLGTAAKLAVPTPDHYYPLLYSLGLQGKDEEAYIFNDKLMAGSLTMTSLVINAG
ncbi:4,5-DOPA dioxygenase extradiol [Ginsengibacter hankyongi]|uniref:4,5-DOPA dioxygenase extradiol n=1 Tax=Ginsengibacter hankyongi TaxID=2607284 RepID=A0A5J5IDX4_9BACT|nr:4,5-DOPA dioxygenase extradiol [Ginsengibacter hankyongi]KAA9038112.1 4,5-DOPA dioxygenase extradiol [Ginsengibacter hankyongi]